MYEERNDAAWRNVWKLLHNLIRDLSNSKRCNLTSFKPENSDLFPTFYSNSTQAVRCCRSVRVSFHMSLMHLFLCLSSQAFSLLFYQCIALTCMFNSHLYDVCGSLSFPGRLIASRYLFVISLRFSPKIRLVDCDVGSGHVVESEREIYLRRVTRRDGLAKDVVAARWQWTGPVRFDAINREQRVGRRNTCLIWTDRQTDGQTDTSRSHDTTGDTGSSGRPLRSTTVTSSHGGATGVSQ